MIRRFLVLLILAGECFCAEESRRPIFEEQVSLPDGRTLYLLTLDAEKTHGYGISRLIRTTDRLCYFEYPSFKMIKEKKLGSKPMDEPFKTGPLMEGELGFWWRHVGTRGRVLIISSRGQVLEGFIMAAHSICNYNATGANIEITYPLDQTLQYKIAIDKDSFTTWDATEKGKQIVDYSTFGERYARAEPYDPSSYPFLIGWSKLAW